MSLEHTFERIAAALEQIAANGELVNKMITSEPESTLKAELIAKIAEDPEPVTKTTRKKVTRKKAPVAEEPEEVEVEAEQSIDIADVRRVMVQLRAYDTVDEKVGEKVGMAILAEYDATRLSQLQESDYAMVVEKAQTWLDAQ